MDYVPDKSVLHLLHRATQVADDIFNRGQEGDALTPRQFVVLAAIARFEGSSQTHITAATGVDRSTMADIVKRLLRKGLVARKRARGDARAYAVKVTAIGRELMERTSATIRRAEQELLAPLSPQARTALITSLLELSKIPQRSEQD